MNKPKPIILTLIIIIGLLVFYVIASGRNSFKKIRSLTTQIEQTVDSLTIIQVRYDSLSLAYQDIEAHLTNTQGNLRQFKYRVDSLLSLRIRSISALNEALDAVIEHQDSLQHVDSLNNNFRFK